MSDEYDVIVIGGGPAGENVVGACAQGGLSTALVESELVGGECSYWACIPSKTLLRPGEVLGSARRVPGARQAVHGGVDASAALARRDEMTGGWDDKSQAAWVDSVGADLVRGAGRLVGERTVEVVANGGARRLRARRAVVLATGSVPFVPPIDGLREARPWGSREATSARSVPRRLLVLGGGVVGVEMAQAYRRLGSDEVTVVEAAPHLLPMEEPFAGEALAETFAAEAISVLTGVKLVEARRDPETGVVTGVLEDGGRIEADEILVAVGRRAATAGLGLETVGLTPGRPVEVDDSMCATGVPGGWLYAVGDVNGRAMLTHMGKYQARVAGDALLGRGTAAAAASTGGVAVADRSAIPRVVFTDPEVAAVGPTERQAREQGLDVVAVRRDLADVAAAATRGEGVRGTCQLLVDPHREVLVGATFTGPDVGELLHAATVAVVGAVPLSQLAHVVASFPTMSEIWLRLLEAYPKSAKE